MHFATLLTLFFAASLSGVSAHFHLLYPPPRGEFVAAAEVGFCDGYTTPAANRTQFPLNGGFISFNGSHPQWTFGVIIAPTSNPTNFANFSQAVPFFTLNGAGPFCFPVDLLASGVNGIQEGVNATLQMIYNAGDGTLYQCADVTLVSNATIPSDAVCLNSSTISTSASASSSAPAPTSTGSSSGAMGMNGYRTELFVLGMFFMGLVGSFVN
ncbi:hypothetical protein C8Q75DRAFT_717203 [Abortiporus biennis]|nr:hypothetical protein C8Q75DRAFT_717203 [Abortiporus biennis]